MKTSKNLHESSIMLSDLPGRIWSMIQEKTPLGKIDSEKSILPAATIAISSLVAGGINGSLQNIEKLGFWSAMTGARLGLIDMDHSALGKSLVAGAAVGASLVIGSYLVREGRRAIKLNNERKDPLSPSNIDLTRIKMVGPDPWAIGRILDKDGKKGMTRIFDACTVHAQILTDLDENAVKSYSTVMLATAILKPGGRFHSGTFAAKQEMLQSLSENLKNKPVTQGLLQVLPSFPGLKEQTSVLAMHSDWIAVAKSKFDDPDEGLLRTAVIDWGTKHFQIKPDMDRTNMIDSAVKSIVDMEDEHIVQKELESIRVVLACAAMKGTVVPEYVHPSERPIVGNQTGATYGM